MLRQSNLQRFLIFQFPLPISLRRLRFLLLNVPPFSFYSIILYLHPSSFSIIPLFLLYICIRKNCHALSFLNLCKPLGLDGKPLVVLQMCLWVSLPLISPLLPSHQTLCVSTTWKHATVSSTLKCNLSSLKNCCPVFHASILSKALFPINCGRFLNAKDWWVAVNRKSDLAVVSAVHWLLSGTSGWHNLTTTRKHTWSHLPSSKPSTMFGSKASWFDLCSGSPQLPQWTNHLRSSWLGFFQSFLVSFIFPKNSPLTLILFLLIIDDLLSSTSYPVHFFWCQPPLFCFLYDC